MKTNNIGFTPDTCPEPIRALLFANARRSPIYECVLEQVGEMEAEHWISLLCFDPPTPGVIADLFGAISPLGGWVTVGTFESEAYQKAVRAGVRQ